MPSLAVWLLVVSCRGHVGVTFTGSGECTLCVNSTPHTSHFLVLHNAHSDVTSTLAQVWRAAHISFHPIFMRS